MEQNKIKSKKKIERKIKFKKFYLTKVFTFDKENKKDQRVKGKLNCKNTKIVRNKKSKKKLCPKYKI